MYRMDDPALSSLRKKRTAAATCQRDPGNDTVYRTDDPAMSSLRKARRLQNPQAAQRRLAHGLGVRGSVVTREGNSSCTARCSLPALSSMLREGCGGRAGAGDWAQGQP